MSSRAATDGIGTVISTSNRPKTKINAQTGTANVKIGDTIKEGDILINGWMDGKYTGIRYVHAKGEIEAKVWHTKNKKVLYKLFSNNFIFVASSI